MSRSPPDSEDHYFTNSAPYPHHLPNWQQSNQASSMPPHHLYETTSHVEAHVGMAASYGPPSGTHFHPSDVPVHHLSSHRAPGHDARAYGDPHRLALPLEARPPARVDTSTSSVGHRDATIRMPTPAPMLVIPNHASPQREWNDHTTSVRLSHREPTTYAMPMRSSSADVYRDHSQNLALRTGAWVSVTGSDPEIALTGSFSPSPVDGRSPGRHQDQFDEQNTVNEYPSGGDSSPSDASPSASDPDTSRTRHSSSPMVSPHRRSPASNSPTRTLRKNKMHTCKVCQKQFPRPGGLVTHMNTHTGDRRT